MTYELASHTTESFAALVAGGRPVVALVPVGSVEPHGPHLSLVTDVVISRGACHAGQYETSILMAAAPELVDEHVRAGLPAVPISLSDQLRAGVTTFAAMGMDAAYAGNPAAASIAEGEQMIERLAHMVVGEVRESLGLPT